MYIIILIELFEINILKYFSYNIYVFKEYLNEKSKELKIFQ